jgi:hypothetical protein
MTWLAVIPRSAYERRRYRLHDRSMAAYACDRRHFRGSGGRRALEAVKSSAPNL